MIGFLFVMLPGLPQGGKTRVRLFYKIQEDCGCQFLPKGGRKQKFGQAAAAGQNAVDPFPNQQHHKGAVQLLQLLAQRAQVAPVFPVHRALTASFAARSNSCKKSPKAYSLSGLTPSASPKNSAAIIIWRERVKAAGLPVWTALRRN